MGDPHAPRRRHKKALTRPGEADLIVAKHRNGPTRDITVPFQGHYSSSVDKRTDCATTGADACAGLILEVQAESWK